MKQIQRLRNLVPPWQMPSDPVKAVWWFLRWSLTLLIHFFWIPVLTMTIFEAILNGNVSGPFSALWSGLVTLFVGLIVWVVLYFLLATINIATRISGTISQISGFQRTFSSPYSSDTFFRDSSNPKVVESTIIEVKEDNHHTSQ